MTGHFDVKRYDYAERNYRLLNGTTKTVPAHYECYYYWNGKEFAHYKSRDDMIYLNSNYLGRDRNLSYIERMKSSDYPEVWAHFAEMLKITENTALCEYFNI